MSDAVRRVSRIDAAARARIEAACGFINAEVRKARGTVLIAALVAGLTWLIVMAFRGPWQLGGGLALLITLLAAGWAEASLKESYKSVVLPRVVKAFGGGLTYSEESRLTIDDFLEMDMFAKIVENFSSEDEVAGRAGEVGWTMQECRATRTEGSGKHRRTVTIFQGLIVRLDFNKNFSGHTIVVANSESQVLGGLFGESEGRGEKTLAKMENPEFEAVYSVYSTNDQQARYILTPKLMELLLKAEQQLETDLRFSFLRNSVFVAVSDRKNRFEASIFNSNVTAEAALEDFVQVVEIAESLVKTLDLETRIWSRA